MDSQRRLGNLRETEFFKVSLKLWFSTAGGGYGHSGDIWQYLESSVVAKT